MVTVQFSRQEKVNMVRRAGLGDAASEACGTRPTRLTSIKSRRGGNGMASPETISSAAWAAAHDEVCMATGPAGGMPPPRLPRAVSMSVNAKGAGRG